MARDYDSQLLESVAVRRMRRMVLPAGHPGQAEAEAEAEAATAAAAAVRRPLRAAVLGILGHNFAMNGFR